uniref:Leucine-rich repeat-containing N-terminal plant-type domain-containing protein n=1 Tax=Ananas comosus var. bracteatus TaxID=296719 RepID=A0A6V7Q7P7_ANACO|nr:unnamed protein product [Ananas comosus var. bracteatus]
MEGFHALIFLIILLYVISTDQYATHGIEPAASDCAALLSFKSLVDDDPFGALSSWNNGSLHYCRWRGVSCGRHHPDRVTALDLKSLRLAGLISPAVANLTFIQRIDLSDNMLDRSIPEELGSLRRLRYLNLKYGMGCKPSRLGDVYSFGILLLEMFTGMSPVDDMFKDGLSLRGYVRAAAASPEHLMDIIDRKLHSADNDIAYQEECVRDCVVLLFDCSLSCSNELPYERCDMTKVLKVLSAARERLLS